MDTMLDKKEILACVLDAQGSAKNIDINMLHALNTEHNDWWVHLDKDSKVGERWIKEHSGLDENTVGSLYADETRPRIIKNKSGLVAILRGINTNPNNNPEDMVSLRIWCDGKRLISVRPRFVDAPLDIFRDLVEQNDGPTSIDRLFEQLIIKLVERMSGVIGTLEEKLDDIEENIEILDPHESQRKLSDLRKQTVGLRRYIAPQREALEVLLSSAPSWLNVKERVEIREATDRLQRYVEALDAAKDRAIVIKDDIAARLIDKTNRTLYIISIISIIFLPLSFILEIVGLNFAGMPSLGNNAFWLICGVLIIVVILEIFVLKKLKWF